MGVNWLPHDSVIESLGFLTNPEQSNPSDPALAFVRRSLPQSSKLQRTLYNLDLQYQSHFNGHPATHLLKLWLQITPPLLSRTLSSGDSTQTLPSAWFQLRILRRQHSSSVLRLLSSFPAARFIHLPTWSIGNSLVMLWLVEVRSICVLLSQVVEVGRVLWDIDRKKRGGIWPMVYFTDIGLLLMLVRLRVIRMETDIDIRNVFFLEASMSGLIISGMTMPGLTQSTSTTQDLTKM